MSDFKPVNQPITPTSADPGEEFPFLHTITVVDRVVSVDNPELVQNNIRTETVTLNLDSEWDGLSCIINIGSGKTPTSLIWSGQPVVIPAELMTDIGTLNVSVVGYGDDGALRAVTKKADNMFAVVASGYVEGDEPVPDPTTILGQLIQAADNANQAADRFNQASEDIGDISDAVTDAKGYADAAKTSETNASASASAAQQAVDGFGLEVGTTTTGEPGSDAAVEIQKQGTKYTANFTIPTGERGPKGDPGDLTPVAHDSTLTGDGTSGTPLGVIAGQLLKAPIGYDASDNTVNLDDMTMEGVYSITSAQNATGMPPNLIGDHTASLLVVQSFHMNLSYTVIQILVTRKIQGISVHLYARSRLSPGWGAWRRFVRDDELNAIAGRVTALEQSLEARVQALEAKLANQ